MSDLPTMSEFVGAIGAIQAYDIDAGDPPESLVQLVRAMQTPVLHAMYAAYILGYRAGFDECKRLELYVRSLADDDV